MTTVSVGKQIAGATTKHLFYQTQSTSAESVNPSSLPDPARVKVSFTVNSTRPENHKRKPVSGEEEEYRTNVNRELACHLDTPGGKLRKELNNRYRVKDVILHYYPQQLTMTVTFAIVHWAAIRFTDHVRQGTVATVIRRHLKNEPAGTDSWELFGKVISVDNDKEEDGGDDVVNGAVDSGARREVPPVMYLMHCHAHRVQRA